MDTQTERIGWDGTVLATDQELDDWRGQRLAKAGWKVVEPEPEVADYVPVYAHWYSLDDQAGDGTATALCGYTWVPDPARNFDNICPPCMTEFLKRKNYGVFICKQTDVEADESPERTQEMIDNGQVWVWMNGPGDPHWEMRGTGLIADGDE